MDAVAGRTRTGRWCHVTSSLTAILSGSGAVRLPHDEAAGQAFLDTAQAHGVECLVRARLRAGGFEAHVPPAVKHALDERARAETAIAALRGRAIDAITQSLHAAGVPAVILKGAALACTHYESSHLRPCRDIDLLVRRTDFATATEVLSSLRYSRRPSVERDVHAQRGFAADADATVLAHSIDLHWAVSNRPLFARMLPVDECLAAAVPVPSLGSRAATLCDEHALLLACIHRVAHHEDSGRFIWLYDIKLLADRLSGDQWERFWSMAREKAVVRLCDQSLRLALSSVGGSPDMLAHVPRPLPSSEPSALYLGGSGTRLRSLRLDVMGSEGVREKLRLLSAHAFPDAVHMQTTSGARGPFGLTIAYARRACRAAGSLFGPA